MTTRKLDIPGGQISMIVDGKSDARVSVVLAHGAGAPMDSPFMAHIASGLAARGHRVIRFNFLYMEQGRKGPDRGPVLEETLRAVVEESRTRGSIVAGGKSLGGRVASLAAAAGMDVNGLLFLGYPLHPPGRPDRIRDEHLYSIAAPMLFIEGTRDPFCPLPTLEEVRKKLPGPNDLAVIESGDHSYKVPRSSGRTTEDAWDEAVAAAANWLDGLGTGR